MSSAEDHEMMARISQLAGQINRHKNEQAGFVPAPPLGRPHNAGYSSGWRRGGHPYQRGAYSGPRMPMHRHRTLVLNGASQENKNSDSDTGTTSDASGPSWVTKTDRHLQLINSSIYQKDAQARTRAIEQTRRQQQVVKNERERNKLINHLNRMANSRGINPADSRPQATTAKYEIAVQGIRFVVAKNGSKLVKIPDASNATNTTPKTAVVGGVRFCRSKNGNLYRHGIVKAQRRAGTVKKVNVPCKIFSMTGNSFFQKPGPRPCRHDWDSVSPWTPTNRDVGSCLQGPRCRYIHDADKVAACKDFLQQGECASGDACDLSHDLSPQRAPTCLHFAKDNCTKPDCRYAHVKVAPAAPVCRSFGIYGYCERGADCPERHAFECPDFSNTGTCKSKRCKLPHRERASALRKANTIKAEDDEMEDLSSDDDDDDGESVDSDDVDSDEVDEFIGQDEADDIDFTEQRDYIAL